MSYWPEAHQLWLQANQLQVTTCFHRYPALEMWQSLSKPSPHSPKPPFILKVLKKYWVLTQMNLNSWAAKLGLGCIKTKGRILFCYRVTLCGLEFIEMCLPLPFECWNESVFHQNSKKYPAKSKILDRTRPEDKCWSKSKIQDLQVAYLPLDRLSPVYLRE